MICGATVQGGGTCILEADHGKTHASVGYVCDGCGKTRRGQPHRTENVWVGDEVDDIFRFCFLCSDERVIGRA